MLKKGEHILGTPAELEVLLEKNKDFGMDKDQITIVKQEKVPAMINNSAHFALVKDKLEIDTKPHGHGDVHTLIHTHGLDKKWEK